jgi:hypothetical protein
MRITVFLFCAILFLNKSLKSLAKELALMIQKDMRFMKMIGGPYITLGIITLNITILKQLTSVKINTDMTKPRNGASL